MPNRLAAERSPYLLQHANNPVEWYPWGTPAFDKARSENKPIFLSIGYSTCHWCHVMEHESFENEAIADVLNDSFVSIKVDREERPDVDRVYMSFVQATTGSGGWPMSVWLTPELKPFYGGTYFPPTTRWGRPGFVELLRQIARVWQTDRGKVLESADELLDRLREATTFEARATQGVPLKGVPSQQALGRAVAEYERIFDTRWGGFGGAPKFPRPAELLFLLREHARTGTDAVRSIVLETLRAMALGGMRDHIGGGFHRYSVDAEWRVPHFEKMLYDQAQLAIAYLEAAQLSGDAFYAAVAEDTLDYVMRDLSDRGGGFHSAEDADSLPPDADDPSAHKMEGAFYIWSESELQHLLGDMFDVVRFRFGIEPHGNAPADPQGEFTNKNLLYVARSIEDVARLTGRTADEVSVALGRARRILFEAREKRPRPHLDDKVLTAWNGLAIAAFARAGRTLRSGSALAHDEAHAGQYLEAAQRAAMFIRDAMWNAETRTLLRRYRDGHAAIDGFCEDYANMISGLIELFQADDDAAWLDWALQLQRRQDELFWDESDGGWFNTTGQDRSVLLRVKEFYDGAEPSASSVSVMNLLTLGHLTGEASHLEKVEATLSRFSGDSGQLGRVAPLMAAATSVFHAGVQQIVVVGGRDAADRRSIESALAGWYLPFSVLIGLDPDTNQEEVARVLPFVRSMRPLDGRATVYVCHDFTCQQPTSDIEEVRRACPSVRVGAS